jgi:hypothetical protein
VRLRNLPGNPSPVPNSSSGRRLHWETYGPLSPSVSYIWRDKQYSESSAPQRRSHPGSVGRPRLLARQGQQVLIIAYVKNIGDTLG